MAQSSAQKIGSFIKGLRRSKGISQDDFAQSIGVSHATLSALENGKGVSSQTLLSALENLGLSLRVHSEEGCLNLSFVGGYGDEEERLAQLSDFDERERVFDAVGASCKLFPAILRAYLFGSFARGDFNDASDVDVRVELDEAYAFNLRDLAQLAKRIEKATGREVDIVSARDVKNASLKQAIEQDKVMVYER